MAMDLKDKMVGVVIMHPGFVRTHLDLSTHALCEAVEPNKAAEKLWEVLMRRPEDLSIAKDKNCPGKI